MKKGGAWADSFLGDLRGKVFSDFVEITGDS